MEQSSTQLDSTQARGIPSSGLLKWSKGFGEHKRLLQPVLPTVRVFAVCQRRRCPRPPLLCRDILFCCPTHDGSACVVATLTPTVGCQLTEKEVSRAKRSIGKGSKTLSVHILGEELIPSHDSSFATRQIAVTGGAA